MVRVLRLPTQGYPLWIDAYLLLYWRRRAKAAAQPVFRPAGNRPRPAAGQQRFRDDEAECPRSPKVDSQSEMRRLLHRKVGRIGTLENAAAVRSGVAKCFSVIGSAAQKAAPPSGGAVEK